MWNRVKALRVLVPTNVNWRKVVLGSVMIGLLVAAFCFGRWGAMSARGGAPTKPGGYTSLPPGMGIMANMEAQPPGAAVAYIYNSVPITRQDLGEYLIARYGAERLEFLVNRKIIEHVCVEKGIYVTEAEIEAQLIEDLKGMGIHKLDDFVNVVLKRFGKSLYEYKEDVIRPKLALGKVCQGKVQVTKQDVENAFESLYGEKRQCRMIVFPKDESRQSIQKVWEEIKNDKSRFITYANKQFIPELASKGGEIPPIFKHFGDKKVEEEAFAMELGDISSILEMPDGTKVILKCEAFIPPDKEHTLETEWTKLNQLVYERKLAEEVPKVFQSLRKVADPKVFLKPLQANDQARARINQVLTKEAIARQKANGNSVSTAGPKDISVPPLPKIESDGPEKDFVPTIPSAGELKKQTDELKKQAEAELDKLDNPK